MTRIPWPKEATGTILRVRLPTDFRVTDGPPIMVGVNSLRRYDVLSDQFVLVTQEWVDLAQRRMSEMFLELQTVKGELAALRHSEVSGVEETRSKQDSLWQALLAACGR